MLDLLAANVANIAVGALVAAIVTAAVAKLIRDKRRHKSSCGCSCSGCPCAGSCNNTPPPH